MYQNILVQHETPTTFGKLSTDKNSTPWSKTKPLFRAFKYILSPCNINVILDLHVSHVGGEAQKNILSILLWAPATFVPRDWLQVKNKTLLNVVVDQSISYSINTRQVLILTALHSSENEKTMFQALSACYYNKLLPNTMLFRVCRFGFLFHCPFFVFCFEKFKMLLKFSHLDFLASANAFLIWQD